MNVAERWSPPCRWHEFCFVARMASSPLVRAVELVLGSCSFPNPRLTMVIAPNHSTIVTEDQAAPERCVVVKIDCGNRGRIRKRPPWADLSKTSASQSLTLPDAIAIATSTHAVDKLTQLQLQRNSHR